MAWRTALTVVRGASAGDLARVGYAPGGATTTPDGAIAAGLGDQLWLVEHGADLVLVGRGPDPELPRTLHAALGVEVVHAFFMGNLDFYTWQVAHAGGHRTWSCGEGEVVVDDGTPLPEEAGIHLLDERRLRRLVEARVEFALADIAGSAAHSLTSSTPERGRGRRRWFGRG
ncbi:hypothetical protein [Nocardioides sp. J54]|uniref:hypothetical protein n=1 Tax=Nocardioides sp. J54 TaxID=935866 RepID=UPI00048D3C5C|nr:hypothetical protein [Nocardioides sp. J54]